MTVIPDAPQNLIGDNALRLRPPRRRT